MKTCTICKAAKPITDFHKNSQSKSGVRPNCKACEIDRKARYRSENAKTVSESAAAYRRANPEKLKALNAKYRALNQDQIKKSKREWSLKNAERVSANISAWRKLNKDRVRELNSAWNSAHPEVMSAIQRTRRARKRNAEGVHLASDIKRIFELQAGLCASCSAKLVLSGNGKYHVDHIQPLARGGSNWPENLQCLCPSCNLKKSSKDPIAWANENGRLL